MRSLRWVDCEECGRRDIPAERMVGFNQETGLPEAHVFMLAHVDGAGRGNLCPASWKDLGREGGTAAAVAA